jgi:hypothetical protein
VGYATLHASGKVAIHSMKSDPSSVLNSVVVAQRFTNALKKNVTFDDIYLIAEEHVSSGFSPLASLQVNFLGTNVLDFAVKVVQQLLRFNSCRFELSKELTIEQILTGRNWDKIVSIQYNLYSRLDKGATIAGNAMLLLQLRAMFLALMMSVKQDSPGAPGTNRRGAAQNMGRVWLSTPLSGAKADRGAAKGMQAPKDFAFKECKFRVFLIWEEADGSFGGGFTGVCSMVDGLPSLCDSRTPSRRKGPTTKTL